ncbi:hypothetical protein GIB67_016861 [Kingdonia uniflora]|uniref:Uncharacterized protein n=1 Tax=Kingdonia uniflora TaxID=39325 RepID=A0A7J7LQ82_9MAGN|nr:hypothetical protein GIB67_016861 [Kingdonia uniflora]
MGYNNIQCIPKLRLLAKYVDKCDSSKMYKVEHEVSLDEGWSIVKMSERRELCVWGWDCDEDYENWYQLRSHPRLVKNMDDDDASEGTSPTTYEKTNDGEENCSKLVLASTGLMEIVVKYNNALSAMISDIIGVSNFLIGEETDDCTTFVAGLQPLAPKGKVISKAFR